MPRPSLSLALLACIGLCSGVQVPYLVLTPGPVFNTIGQVDGKDAIVITGARTYPTEGALDMTTVSEFGGADGGVSVGQAVLGWVSPTRRVVPRETIYPESESHAQAVREKAEAFATSQSHAISAALRQLGRPVRTAVVVSSVEQGAPAQDRLRAGDQITAVDGIAVATPKDVVDAVRGAPVGTEHTFDVLRGGTALPVTVASGSRADDPATPQDEAAVPYVGVGIDTLYSGDFDVSFSIERVGGPSAGMMFALGLVDKLTPGALTAGRTIAGTGTIDPDGNVGPIGGIAQKMAGARGSGAELFLAPESNCADVVGHIPAGLTVTPVSTLAEAVTAIGKYTAGQPLPSCR